ncbi:LD-carboxypeptidase [Shigella flexneri]
MPKFHLIAPSGYCVKAGGGTAGVAAPAGNGPSGRIRQLYHPRMQRFAGTEARRLSDINSLVTLEGKNNIVLAVRGGYGASRLLESIDWARAGRTPGPRASAVNLRSAGDFTAIQLGLLALHNVHYL